MVVIPLVLSPKPPAPNSPYMSLVHYALPLPETRVSDYKCNFLHCFLKYPLRSSLLLQSSLPGIQKPPVFLQLGVIGPPFQALLLYVGKPILGYKAHTSQGERHSHLNIPLELQLPPVGAQPALSHCLHTPYLSHIGEVLSSVSPSL